MGCGRPPVIRTYKGKGKRETAPPAAQTQLAALDKSHQHGSKYQSSQSKES